MNSLYKINYLKGKNPITMGFLYILLFYFLGVSPLEISIL